MNGTFSFLHFFGDNFRLRTLSLRKGASPINTCGSSKSVHAGKLIYVREREGEGKGFV